MHEQDRSGTAGSRNTSNPGGGGGGGGARAHKDVFSELQKLLECPICTRAVHAPVYQCGAGHIICSRCKSALPLPKKCPSCRQLLGDIRVRALELMAENVPYPCENTEYGCTECLPAPLRQRHEEFECKFALFDCPNPTTEDCKWQGKSGGVVAHLKEVHEVPSSSFSFGEHEEEWCLTCDELGEGDYWLYTAKVKGRDFILHAREADGKFFVNIRSVSFESPGRFSIRMKLKNGFEQVQSGPILTVRDPQHEGVWFGVQSDMICFNPGGGMSIYITVRVHAHAQATAPPPQQQGAAPGVSS